MDSPFSDEWEDVFNQHGFERMPFKNMQIHLMDLDTLQSQLDFDDIETKHKCRTPAVENTTLYDAIIDCNQKNVLNFPERFIRGGHVPWTVTMLVTGMMVNGLGLELVDLCPATRLDESELKFRITKQVRGVGLGLPYFHILGFSKREGVKGIFGPVKLLC